MPEHTSDHDLLIRISVQLEGLSRILDTDRAAWNAIAAKHEVELDILRKQHAKDIAELQKQLNSLDRSRAMFMGAAAVMSAAISAIVQHFSK